MRILGLIFREIIHHRTNTALSVLAVMAAVAMCVSLVMTQEASYRETKRIMRDMGFNVRIIPKATDMGDFYLKGFSEHTFSEEAIHRLASQENISYNHLVATLQQQMKFGDMTVVVMGLSGELFPPGRKKPLMSHPIKPGTVHVGYEIARHFGLKKGDSISLGGETFTISLAMPESGSTDDIRIFGALPDIQRLLGLEGQINEIKAIDCLCLTPDEDPQAILRAELNRVIPEAQTFLLSDMAEARARQRKMVEKYMAFLIPLFLVLSGVLLAALVALNVRARQAEIGVLRALGYGSSVIGALFLGKAIVVGLIGAGIGYGVGTWLAVSIAPSIFQVTAKGIKAMPELLGWSLLIAPIFAAVVSFIPAVIAVTQDPATTLRAE
jgi:putative ABC transport system permease protein